MEGEEGLIAELRRIAQNCRDMGLTAGTKEIAYAVYLDAARMAKPYEARRIAAESRVAELEAGIKALNERVEYWQDEAGLERGG